MKTLSLRSRILLPIIALLIIGMGTAATLSNRATSTIVQNIITTDLELLAQNLTTQVSSWVADLQADLQTMTKSEIYLDCLLNQDLASYPYYADSANSSFAEFAKRYGLYDSLALINKSGKAVASSDPNLIGKLDIHDRDYFIKAINGQGAISNTVKSRATGHPIFVLAEPIKVNNEVVGVILGAIEMTRFSEKFILPIKIGDHGYAYMTDAAGVMSAHPNPEAILKFNLNDYDWSKEILTRKNGHMEYDFQGVDKIAVFRTDPATGWTIVIGASKDDVFSGIHKANRNNSGIGLITVVILALVIVFLVRPIVNSMKTAIAFAKEIQEGELSDRLAFTRRDEIGQLGNALDSMADSLQQRAEIAEAIAHGDLTQEVKLMSDKDVLGRALQGMTEKLNDIISQINAASEQIDSGAGQVSDSAQDLSQGATQQAASIEEIGASLNELSGRTHENAQNAQTANQLAITARDAANSGSIHMQDMVTAMEDINQSGQSISKIIKTIDEIAFQTNLLALNAAVEAARAGQQGKGFAVVAEEVRNLAARSAKAAQETAELIEGTVAKGKNGTEIANRTANALTEIVEGIGKTADLVGEIAASSTEQADGINQVNEGVSQIDQVIQRNTAGAEEGAAAAEELSSQSAYMRDILSQFKLRGQAKRMPDATKSPAQRPVPSIPTRATLAAAPKPILASQKKHQGTTGWDTMGKTNKPVIALDDEEFGKY